MIPCYSEAFRRWRSAPFSTPYPPTTLESSPDSSSEISLDSSLLSVGPSRKRCRSPTTSMPSSTPVSRSIAPTHADLLPPHKKAVVDLGICDGVRAHTEDGLGIGVEIAASDIREAEDSAGGMVEVEVDPRVRLVVDEDVYNHVIVDGAVEVTYETLGYLVQIFHDHTEEILVHQIQVTKTAQRYIERDWVDSLRHHTTLSQEEFRQIRRDRDDARRRFRRLESLVERRLGFLP
ncbi:hypothetical protein Tco_0129658 [Tanacetum coccineum]